MKRRIKITIMGVIFNKSRFSRELNQYLISFRVIKKIKEISLPKFIKEIDSVQKISSSRIKMNKKIIRFYVKKISNLDD
jgi:hypothetical protein